MSFFEPPPPTAGGGETRKLQQKTSYLVQVAHPRVRVLGQVLPPAHVQVQLLRELVQVVDLHHRVPREVVLEPLELQLQHRRKIVEEHAFFRVLKAMAFGIVLVLAVERLDRRVRVKTRIDVLAPFDVQLQVHERLLARALALHVDAPHKVLGVALKQPRDSAVDGRPLHLLLELLAQDAVELLHVVLHERVDRVPAERPRQVLGRHRRGAKLELEEEALQRERDRGVRLVVGARRHVVHGPAERVEVVEGLEKRVHVAGRALVLEADWGFFFSLEVVEFFFSFSFFVSLVFLSLARSLSSSKHTKNSSHHAPSPCGSRSAGSPGSPPAPPRAAEPRAGPRLGPSTARSARPRSRRRARTRPSHRPAAGRR